MRGVWAVVGVLLVGCGSGYEPMDVGDVSMSVSPGGRVAVTFEVTNDTGRHQSPECTVRVRDADGFRVGTDRVGGGVPLSPGGSDVYSAVTGVDAADAFSVTVEC